MGQPARLRTAVATQEFWNAYNKDRAGFLEIGITVRRRGSQWLVKWWADEFTKEFRR